MANLPTIRVFDNYLNKEIILTPDVFISHDGRLVISYESEPQNYRDFENDGKSESWSIGDKNHLVVLS